MSKEMQEVIIEEEHIREDAHLIWEFLEEMYAEPQVTLEKKQDDQSNNALASMQRSVIPLGHTSQIGSSRGAEDLCSEGTNQQKSIKATTFPTSSCPRGEKKN
jgi:hypothetical protein